MNIFTLDQQLFESIHGLSGLSMTIDWIGIFMAKYLIWSIVLIAFVWWMELARTKPSSNWPVLGKKKWLEMGSISLSIIWAVIISQLISLSHFRSRPFVNLDTETLIGLPYSVKSFPSDHATIAFAIAMAVFFYNKFLGTILLILSVAVALGRVFVGVHYPLDVVVGAIVGIIAAIIIRIVMLAAGRNKK